MNWKTYFIVEASGSTTPTAAQIKAGTNASNTAALSWNAYNVNPALEYTNNTGLISGTAYVVYSVRRCREFTNYSKHIKCYHFSVAVPSLTTKRH
jgi:hypothetical protein